MATVTLDEIQRDFLGYLHRVQAGETLVIVQVDKPVATIKPIETNHTRELRPFGLCAGEFRVPDDFDDPLPEEIIGSCKNRVQYFGNVLNCKYGFPNTRFN